jgi:hypothetical protein
MGELRRGLDAKIKFHAFPYQDYGTFSGQVLDISPDTVDVEGSLFEITVSCPIEEIREGTGKEEILGFAADLDIVTGREPLLARLLGRRRAGAAD